MTPGPASLLVDPERHPLRPAEAALALGSVLVVAPHPDDETLGCGGLLALLAAAGRRPQVVVMTDGARSHPHSRTHPGPRLAALREVETRAALTALGLPEEAAIFLRYGDCALPAPGTPAFAEATERVRRLLLELAPETVLVPWRRDPHCDHEATWRLLRAAVRELPQPPRWLEYPVWAWTQPQGEVAPRRAEAEVRRLDISDVLARKEQAIAQHASQLGEVIRDDPTGFSLEPAVLAHFTRSWELYLIPADV